MAGSNMRKSTRMIGGGKNEHKVMVQEFFAQGKVASFFFMLAVLTLFGDDLRTAFLSASLDIYVDAILIFCFCIFSAEIMINIWAIDEYTKNLIFWMDLVSTASILLDVSTIMTWVANIAGEDDQYAQIGRSARAGTRAGKVMRIMRAVRVARIIKLFRFSKTFGDSAADRATAKRQHNWKRVSDRSAQHVVVAILVLLIALVALGSGSGDGGDGRVDGLFQLENSKDFVDRKNSTSNIVELFELQLGAYKHKDLLYLKLIGEEVNLGLGGEVSIVGFRKTELLDFSTPTGSRAVWSIRGQIQAEALYHEGIAKTTVVIVVLIWLTHILQQFTDRYVVQPIDAVVVKMDALAANSLCYAAMLDIDVEDETGYEMATQSLETTINRLGAIVRKGDELLLGLLPRDVIRKLANGRTFIASEYEGVTAMFTDIVGFTPLSAKLSPLQLVVMLNKIYCIFDHILEKHNVYKVETIGDAYFLVSGCPEPSPTHARQCVESALDLLFSLDFLGEVTAEFAKSAMRKERREGGEGWQHTPEKKIIDLRIGIHSGPVTAGVIGLKNPRWHLFGDTINTASRMESNGVPGQIQVSETTYKVVKDMYNFKKRPDMEIKGKGKMTTYLLSPTDYNVTSLTTTDSPLKSKDGESRRVEMKTEIGMVHEVIEKWKMHAKRKEKRASFAAVKNTQRGSRINSANLRRLLKDVEADQEIELENVRESAKSIILQNERARYVPDITECTQHEDGNENSTDRHKALFEDNNNAHIAEDDRLTPLVVAGISPPDSPVGLHPSLSSLSNQVPQLTIPPHMAHPNQVVPM